MPNIDQILRDVQEKLVSRAKQQLQKRNSESRGRARERARAILTSAFQNNGRITRVNELERLFKPYHLNLGPSDLIALLRTFTGRDSSTTGRANRDCIGNHNQFVFRSAKFVNQVFREEIAYEKSGSVSHSNISEVKKKQQTAGYRKGRMGGGQKSKAAISTRMKKVGEKKGSSVAKDTNGIETTAGEKGPKPTVGLPTRLTSQSQAAGREVGGKVIDVLDTVHFRERQKRSARRTKTPRSGRGDFRADEEKRVKKIDSQTKRDDKYTRPPPLKRAESMTTGSSTNRIQNRKTRKNRITMRISSAQKEKEKATRSDALPSSTVTAPSPSLSSLEQHWQRLQEHEESRGTQQEEGWAQKGERRSMKVVSDVHAAVKSGRLQAFNYTPTSQQLKHPLVGDVLHDYIVAWRQGELQLVRIQQHKRRNPQINCWTDAYEGSNRTPVHSLWRQHFVDDNDENCATIAPILDADATDRVVYDAVGLPKPNNTKIIHLSGIVGREGPLHCTIPTNPTVNTVAKADNPSRTLDLTVYSSSSSSSSSSFPSPPSSVPATSVSVRNTTTCAPDHFGHNKFNSRSFWDGQKLHTHDSHKISIRKHKYTGTNDTKTCATNDNRCEDCDTNEIEGHLPVSSCCDKCRDLGKSPAPPSAIVSSTPFSVQTLPQQMLTTASVSAASVIADRVLGVQYNTRASTKASQQAQARAHVAGTSLASGFPSTCGGRCGARDHGSTDSTDTVQCGCSSSDGREKIVPPAIYFDTVYCVRDKYDPLVQEGALFNSRVSSNPHRLAGRHNPRTYSHSYYERHIKHVRKNVSPLATLALQYQLK